MPTNQSVNESINRHWVIIPAAGIGARMQADRPKQYLPLAGKSVIEHTLARFIAHPAIVGMVVALSEQDPFWDSLQIKSDKPMLRAQGGAERCHSVLNALELLGEHAEDSDWVLVHDAARPCVRREDIDTLMHSLQDHEVGGLLAIPVRDTMKHSNAANEVEETLERSCLWHALTPQMFRLGLLREALREALQQGVLVTDESSAMEHAGMRPLLVEGHADNIKITRPEDLVLAEFYINQQRIC
jgi:2-C-methyl-D-erythritol 4-phosphate cytidylyltransferase